MTVLKRNPNRIRRGFGSRLFDVINIVLLVLLALTCIYPFWDKMCIRDRPTINSVQ